MSLLKLCLLGIAVCCTAESKHWLPGTQALTTQPTSLCGDQPSVETRNGTICGRTLPELRQDVFLGVPYAAPPVGELRFRHPQPYLTTYSSLDTTKQPNSCPGYAGFDVGIGPLGEDCLFINVVRPSTHSRNASDSQGYPVLVWIYGGGFDAGGIADERFNMSYLVAQSVAIGNPIIGVSLNYRVGGWGFLAAKEVLAAGAANVGLMDQRLALRYVHENIAGFGGDPSKITIWGESAGAFSVGYHLTMFDGNSENLFRAAILESGSALGPALPNHDQLELQDGFQTQYDDVTTMVGCHDKPDSLACLRERPYDVLFEAFKPQIYTPIIDGTIIKRLPSESFDVGLVAPVALLIGSNTDEGTASFWGPRKQLNTTDDVGAWISKLNGGGLSRHEVDEVLRLYPDDPDQGCPFDTGSERFADQGLMYKRGAAIATDLFVAAGRRSTAKFFAARQGRESRPVYSYRFDQPPWNGVVELIATDSPVYSTHFSEMGFVFNNPSSNLSTWIGPDPTYHELSSLMSRAWVSFAHSLDPNKHSVKNVPRWPRYHNHYPRNMVFRTSGRYNGTYVEHDHWREAQISFWSRHWKSLRT